MRKWRSVLGVCALSWVASPLVGQSPSQEVLQLLDYSEAKVRLEAAMDLAQRGNLMDAWLFKNMKKGTPERQRALLLAASLRDTPEFWKALSQAAGRRTRSDSKKPFALLLYGMLHPEAGKEIREDLERASNSYERLCLLQGLLCQAQQVPPDALLNSLKKEKSPEVLATAQLILALQETSGLTFDLASAAGLSSAAFASLLPNSAPVPAEAWNQEGLRIPQAWEFAARRSPARAAKEWKRLPLAGEGIARVFALRELTAPEQAKSFLWFQSHLRDADGLAWLWGLLPELGLTWPLPKLAVFSRAEASAILLYAVKDFEAAQTIAILRLPAARAHVLKSPESPLDSWPAAAILALAGQREDLTFLQGVLGKASPAERQRFHPLWLLASRKLPPGIPRENYLFGLARELKSGVSGFLDQQSWLFAGFFLLKGTEVAEFTPALQLPSFPLHPPLAHPLSDALFEDILALLQGPIYRWNLPTPR